MPDGSLRLDVKETLKTDDNELILIEYSGITGDGKELDGLGKGETPTPKDVYWITAPKFTTASQKYGWINKIQVVGKMVEAQSGRIRYDIFAAK